MKSLRERTSHAQNMMLRFFLGDLNAQVGREDAYRLTAGFCDLHKVTNENGLRLKNFAAAKNMVIKSTYFMHKWIHFETWDSRKGNTRNQIDLLIIDGRHSSDVIEVKARRGANADTDHFLIQIKLRARVSLANNRERQIMKSFDVEKLKIKESAAKYMRKFDDNLCNNEVLTDLSTNVDEKWQRTATTTKNTAAETLGYIRTQRSQHWFDDECEAITSEKNEAYQK